MWILFLALAIITAVTEKILHRINLAKFKDASIYTFAYQIFAALLLFLASGTTLRTIEILNAPTHALFLLVLQGLFWSLFAYFSFRADQLLPASHSAILSRLRMLWSLPIGWFVFGETINLTSLIGVGVIFASVVLLNYKSSQNSIDRRGNKFAIFASIAIALSLTIDKILLKTFAPELVAIFAFFFSGLLMAFSIKDIPSRLKVLYLSGGFRYLLPSIIGAISHVSLLKALGAGPFSIVIPIYQAGTILTVLAGIYLLKEHENKRRKLVAVFISYLGILILNLR